jgi:hypothetical protein
MEESMAQSSAQRADAQNEETTSSAARRPVKNIRHGNVEIAIWRNEGEKGPFYSASAPAIRYNDNGEWKDGSSFGRHDLLDLAEVSREAATEIRNLQQARSQGQSR